MDDVPNVRVLDGKCQRADQYRGVGGRLGFAGEVPGEGTAINVLHREIRPALVLAGLKDLNNVGVPHPRRRLGLDAKPGPLLSTGKGRIANQLERHYPSRARLPRLVDDPHAASAQLFEDLVTRHARHARRGYRRPVTRRRTLGHLM
jgi:hypothetical protein